MKIDMSPEAITNRLKTMEQLWELSVSLMQAKEISEMEKSLEKDMNSPCEDKPRQNSDNYLTENIA